MVAYHLLTQEGAAWVKPEGVRTVKAFGNSVCLLVAPSGESCGAISLLVIQISHSAFIPKRPVLFHPSNASYF